MPRLGRTALVNAGLAAAAMLLLFAMEQSTGRIPVNEGRGWDGVDYSNMLNGWDHGTVNTALRPLIVLLNRPAYRLIREPVAAFRAMNYVYIGLLCFSVCLLFDRYSTDIAAKVFLVLNLFVSIAIAKYVAFYPVLIDAGAYALISLSVYFIVAGPRPVAAVVAVAAVLAREFAIAAIAFGVVRDLRRRVPAAVVAATYAPAMAVYFGWRWHVAERWSGSGGAPLGLARLASNLHYWNDPFFAALFVYFALTVFGGISLFVFARGSVALRQMLREPEWAVYGALVLSAAALGDADLWRYLAYLLPVVVVLFAVCAREVSRPWHRIVFAAIVCIVTFLTQRPFEPVDLSAYFLDWFPYYLRKGENLPFLTAVPSLWPVWGWRFLAIAGLLWLLAVFALKSEVIRPIER